MDDEKIDYVEEENATGVPIQLCYQAIFVYEKFLVGLHFSEDVFNPPL